MPSARRRSNRERWCARGVGDRTSLPVGDRAVHQPRATGRAWPSASREGLIPCRSTGEQSGRGTTRRPSSSARSCGRLHAGLAARARAVRAAAVPGGLRRAPLRTRRAAAAPRRSCGALARPSSARRSLPHGPAGKHDGDVDAAIRVSRMPRALRTARARRDVSVRELWCHARKARWASTGSSRVPGARAAAPFVRQYRVVREREGFRTESPDYYRKLPAVAADDPHAGDWRIRRESFANLVERTRRSSRDARCVCSISVPATAGSRTGCRSGASRRRGRSPGR